MVPDQGNETPKAQKPTEHRRLGAVLWGRGGFLKPGAPARCGIGRQRSVKFKTSLDYVRHCLKAKHQCRTSEMPGTVHAYNTSLGQLRKDSSQSRTG